MTRTVQAVLNQEPKNRFMRRNTRPRTARTDTLGIEDIADRMNYVEAWQSNRKRETGKSVCQHRKMAHTS